METKSVIDFSSRQSESNQSETLSLHARKLKKADLIARHSTVFHALEREEQHEAVMHIYSLL